MDTDIAEPNRTSATTTITTATWRDELNNVTDWSTEATFLNSPNNFTTEISKTTTFTTSLSTEEVNNVTTSWNWKKEVYNTMNNWKMELNNNTTRALPLTSPGLNNPMIKPNHNATEGTSHGGYQAPGTMEAIVIVCIVVFILVVVAKYLGCHFFACCVSRESNSDHQQVQRTRIQNVLHRPEYNRPLQYAVYSRPTTAHITQVDARGYGYAGGADDDEEQAKVFTRRDDNIIDPPPDYNSLVPPTYATAYNYYTYSASNAANSNVGDVQL